MRIAKRLHGENQACMHTGQHSHGEMDMWRRYRKEGRIPHLQNVNAVVAFKHIIECDHTCGMHFSCTEEGGWHAVCL